jgi:type IV secretory pathway TraG/TraD family ATPase VirD4
MHISTASIVTHTTCVYMESGSSISVRKGNFLQNLQNDVGLNQTSRAIVLSVWAGLAFLINLPESASGFSLFCLITAVVIHFFWSGEITQFNFSYIKKRSLDPNIFYTRHKNFWVYFTSGLLFSLLIFLLTRGLGTIVGSVCSIIGASVARQSLLKPLDVEYVEGVKPTDFSTLKEHYHKLKPTNDSGVFFGGLLLPISEVNTHFKLVGTSGSGKTNLLRLYMQSVLPRCGTGKPDRAMIYDPATQFLPVIAGMGVDQKIIRILNPFDARAHAWDMAADLTRGKDAIALANILLPSKKDSSGGNNEFFEKATRRVFSGMANLFMRYAPGVWTLRDLVLATQSLELMTAISLRDKKLGRALSVLGSGDTMGNVMATIGATVGNELEIIAAYLDHHQREGRSFSIKGWFQDNSILLLGSDREGCETLQPYNQLLFTRTGQVLTNSEKNDCAGYTHIILDELPSLGKLENIEQVAREGRKYGASLCIAFQAITDLEHIYGEKLANSLIAQCDKAAYLRSKDRKTAEWASSQLGNMRILRRNKTVGTSQTSDRRAPVVGGSTTRSESWTEQHEQRPVFDPDVIQNAPKPDVRTSTGVLGFYDCDNHVFKNEITSAFLSQNMLPSSQNIPAFVSADNEEEEIRLWDHDDIDRLGINMFLEAFEGKDIRNLPFEEWVRLGEATLLPPVDLLPESDLKETL